MDDIDFYTGDERRVMGECNCELNKILSTFVRDGEGEAMFEGFGELVSRGRPYVELTMLSGMVWVKEVWVFNDREGMDRYLRRFPGHMRFIVRDFGEGER